MSVSTAAEPGNISEAATWLWTTKASKAAIPAKTVVKLAISAISRCLFNAERRQSKRKIRKYKSAMAASVGSDKAT